MPNYSKQCQPLATKLAQLEAEVTDLQKDLQGAAPGQKAAFVGMIKKAEAAAAKQRGLLATCVKKHPYVPPKPPPGNPCLKLRNEANKLSSELEQKITTAVAGLQRDLQTAPPGAKAALVGLIKKTRADLLANDPLAAKIAAKTAAYDQCIISHGGVLAVGAQFVGSATIWTSNGYAPGPYTDSGLTIGLMFGDWNHAAVSITSFPSIPFPPNNPEVIVSLITGSGHYSPQTHEMSIQLSLYFTLEIMFATNSRLDISLSTNNTPMTSSGAVTLMGSAPFSGGSLDGDTGIISVTGTITPHP